MHTETDPDALPPTPVLPFVMRSGTTDGSLGHATHRPKVLEVNQVWGDTLVDTQHFRASRREVSMGAEVGWRWTFLGIDMGWVPAPLHLVLPYVTPLWSEVRSDWRSDFFAPDDDLPHAHKLFRHDGEGWVAELLPRWEGFADLDGLRHDLSDLVDEGLATRDGEVIRVPMVDGLRLLVDADGQVFFTQLVPEGAKLAARSGEEVDYPFVAMASFVGFVGMMFGLVMLFSGHGPRHDIVEVPDRFVNLIIETPEDDEPEPTPKQQRDPDAGEGDKPKDDEGTKGKKDATKAKAKGSPKEVAKQQLDRQIAEAAGVLGALDDLGQAAGLGAGALDALSADIGGLRGKTGTQIGSNGLGSRDGGLGGGGNAEGLDGLGTNGLGSGRDGYGSEGGIGGPKSQGGIGGGGGDPIILGSLERSLIDEVIKRNLPQIRYCYQRELTRHPELGGKVVMKFTIAGDGTVSAASTKSSSLGNEAVENCLVGRFMRMQFPAPEGRGIVIVSYPFLFSS